MKPPHRIEPFVCPTLRLALLIALAVVLITGSSARAQTSGSGTLSPEMERIRVRKEEAYIAFKSGDISGALAKLTENIKRGFRERDEDYQLGGQLVEIGCRFSNEKDNRRASEAAVLSLERLARAAGRQSGKEQAASFALTGQIYDHLLGDSVKARAAYEKALTADASLTVVAERLAHLNAVEAHAKEKATGNEILRQRLAPKG